MFLIQSAVSAAPPIEVGPIPEPLSLADAVRIGLQRNPQAAAGEAGVAAAQATYRSNAAFPPLVLGVTHAVGTSSAPTLTGLTTDTFLDFSDSFDTSRQRHLQAAGSKEQYHAAGFQQQETRLTLSQQIRDAYWGLAAARAQTAVAQETLADAQRVRDLTQLQFTAGSSPQVDVIRSSVDLANAQQANIQAQGGEQSALAALNVLLARPPLQPVTLAEALSDAGPAPTAMPQIPPLDVLTRLAVANRPAVLAARAQVQVGKLAVRQAQAARYPDITLDYERSVQLPSDSLVVSAQFPLLDFGSIRQSIRAAAANEKQLEFQEVQAEQQVTQQVAQAYTDYTQAQLLAASYSTQILQPSVRLVSMAQLGYQQGATGILPVIDAENTLRAARNGYIASLLALYKAEDEMLAATGKTAADLLVAQR